MNEFYLKWEKRIFHRSPKSEQSWHASHKINMKICEDQETLRKKKSKLLLKHLQFVGRQNMAIFTPLTLNKASNKLLFTAYNQNELMGLRGAKKQRRNIFFQTFSVKDTNTSVQIRWLTHENCVSVLTFEPKKEVGKVVRSWKTCQLSRSPINLSGKKGFLPQNACLIKLNSKTLKKLLEIESPAFKVNLHVKNS